MKPLLSSQEKGMLLQAPLGRYTSFLYENAVLIGHIDFMLGSAMQDTAAADKYLIGLRDGSASDRRMFQELHMCGAARANQSINGVFSSIVNHYKHGVKGVSPSEEMANSMALTEANYESTDFKLPYNNMVFEIPRNCCDRLKGSFDADNPANALLLEQFGIDPNNLTNGFKVAYILLSISDHDKYFVEEFQGYADRTINVEIVTEDFIRGKMIVDSDIPNILKYPINFNPSPVCVYSRPLVEGKTMEEVLSFHAGKIKDTPGAWAPEKGTNDTGSGIVEDWRLAADDEHEYIIRLTRMATNCIHAITQIGFDENKKPVPDKLIKRGSFSAKRMIPDILTPIALVSDQAKKVKYDDTSTGYSGVVKDPHFRRGHWRRQRHGKDNQEIKTIWIAPLIVNQHLLRDKADENVIKNATAK
jgi:hypothetical protein